MSLGDALFKISLKTLMVNECGFTRLCIVFGVVVATQLAFTCLKSRIESLEKGVNMLKVKKKDTRTISKTQF